ncbi:MAG: UDP-galactose transporter [Candelina submexicana]|nr:MAG: UDP-galactose transporter [Candelina submexicana]
MARKKQTTPSKGIPPLGEAGQSEARSPMDRHSKLFNDLNGKATELDVKYTNGDAGHSNAPASAKQAGLPELVICIAGIYASFLSWALLQERITTTPYGLSSSPEVFSYSIFLNTIQSAFAALTGYFYLRSSTQKGSFTPSIFPSRRVLGPLILIAITSSLASPFGYASLKHIDYITFILAKSCKLLPVMALHLTIFRKRYPLYKYAVVALVTAGVAIFTLHHPSSSKKKGREGGSSAWGLMLLGINLLFDGLTNSTQDYIFQTFKPYSGPQMMCAQNIMSTALTVSYLLASPFLAQSGLGEYLGVDIGNGGGEFREAMAFISRHPMVGRDVFAFAACGAVGQLFICKSKSDGAPCSPRNIAEDFAVYTLSNFSSLLLVTVTVTRKMLTMILSVLWFGHRLSGMQWLGVGLVFGGVGAEGMIQRREKAAKELAKRREASKGEKEL